MAPQELEKDSLAKKHRNYNNLLKIALANNESLQAISNDGNDIENLLKIDIACSTRNVDYIFDVLKSNDILYVSRAIKRSTWLITDKQYAPFINVKYLSTQLFPYMMTKAINKFVLKIRLNLRDTNRVEEFYNYFEKENDRNNAIKWLQRCSLFFIEDVIKKLSFNLPVQIFRRLCKQSINILKIYLQNENIYTYGVLKATLFFLNTQPETYLDILESVHHSKYPTFGVKYTNILMKSFRARILNNFEKYGHCVHFPTFAKYLNEYEIRKIIIEDFKNEDIKYLFTYGNIKYLIKQITKDGKFACLKKTIIDKMEVGECCDCIMYSSIANMNWYSIKTYQFYEFAPFADAFNELKKLLRIASSPAERNAIICYLLHCAGEDSNKLLCVLQYYHDKHMNEPMKFKIDFINCLLKNVKINLDEKFWGILNRIFYSMEVYTELDNNTQNCVQAILVHNAIIGENNPDIIEKKFSFDTLKKYRSKLNKEEQDKVFHYLYNFYLSKLDEKENISKFNFSEIVYMVTNILQLLVDWEKELQSYPVVLNIIKELAKIKQDKECNTSLAAFYNVKKSWRKYMFEDSFILYPSEDVCINALKQDTDLLTRYKAEVIKMSSKKTLTRFLKKLRVYWSHTIMTEYINMYIKSLENIGSHKPIIRGLMTMLPHEQLLIILKKYAPDEIKIDWIKHDACVVSIRKYIAMSMYLSRPLISVDMVLMYARGDYLQYTVSSLNSILDTLSRNQSYVDIPKLLKSPVSLQKYGIRFVATKTPTTEIKPLFLHSWNSTKNLSIRSVLFIQTFRTMCQSNNTEVVKEMLSLLIKFINNLSAEENKNIYNCLGRVKDVPSHIRGTFFMESYNFLTSLSPKVNGKGIVKRLVEYTPEVMEYLEDDFIMNMLKDVGETLKNECKFLNVICSYLLCCKNEETQYERFKAVLAPLMDQYLPFCNDEYNKNIISIQNNFQTLFRNLTTQLKPIIINRKNVIPSKLFITIQTNLEKILLEEKNYAMLTGWKLKVIFVMLLEQHKSMILSIIQNQNDNKEDIIWNKILLSILPSFAEHCYEILKEDAKKYLNIVYIFNDVVQDTLEDISCTNRMDFLKYMLNVSSSSEDYVHLIYMCPQYTNNVEEDKSLEELRQLLNKLTPMDVKIHYHNKFDKLISNT